MKTVVLKFGGTASSTKNNRDNIVKIVQKLKNNKIVIVISAMGRLGFPYATDTLNNLITTDNVTRKERDRLLSCGEIIASVVLSSQLNENNIKSYALSVKETGIQFENCAINPHQINELLLHYDVLVMPGFVALDKNDEIRTLNRGGSDLSACVVAHGLEIKNVYLFKDVDGIFPFYSAGLNNIKPLENISYEEALKMCDIGYHIIQKEAIKFASDNNLKIIVCNYLTSKVGTVISQESSQNEISSLSFTKDTIKIATGDLEKICDDISKLLLDNHVLYKNIIKNQTFLEFVFRVNQTQMAKRIIINKYFEKYLIQ